MTDMAVIGRSLMNIYDGAHLILHKAQHMNPMES